MVAALPEPAARPAFHGSYTYTVDPKGRVSLPRPWMEALGGVANVWWPQGAPYFLLVPVGALPALWQAGGPRWLLLPVLDLFACVAPYSRNRRFMVPLLARKAMGISPGDDVEAVGAGAGAMYWPRTLLMALRGGKECLPEGQAARLRAITAMLGGGL